MEFVGTYLCLLNVILLSSILHNCCYMYLFVLGNLPLSLCIFTHFFLRSDSTLLLTKSQYLWSQHLFLLSRYAWVLLRPIVHSILKREMGVESLKLVSLKVLWISCDVNKIPVAFHVFLQVKNKNGPLLSSRSESVTEPIKCSKICHPL